MINANDIIWTKELVRCTHSSFWKKTIKNLASLGIGEKNNKNTPAVCVGHTAQKL